MHIVSAKVAKTLVWKHEHDVKLCRHKKLTTNINGYHMPLNETTPWKFSAYATVLWCLWPKLHVCAACCL